MTTFFVLALVALVGVVVGVAAGRIGGGLADPVTSLPRRGLPEGPLGAAELDALTFEPALRGYRMDQVDAAVDRLRAELLRRDAELDELRAAADERAAHGATGLSADVPADGR